MRLVSALDAKLLRDLRRLAGPAAAVALVIASGVALLVMSLSALSSLQSTMDAYYDRARFAEVFAPVKRAPERLAERIADIPGVRTVETRVVGMATAEIEGFGDPVTALTLSLPETRAPRLNALAMRSGRAPAPGRTDEAVLLEPFAEAHGLRPGDGLTVLMNGTRRTLRVVGTALSVEHVYAIAPGGLMPDPERFGVIWMGRDALAAAWDMEGAFNSVTLGLVAGVEPRAVIERLDALLAPWGGTGAIPRADQISHWFLTNELAQLRTQATVLPTIFLAVAAFLANTVLARLIETERREIALMKAFGYSNLAVGWHYAKLALAMAGLGVLAGWLLGSGLGRWNTELYGAHFRFPFLEFRPGAPPYAISAAASLGAALFGALFAVRRAVVLPPAEAMRPPAPDRIRVDLPDAALRALDSPTRIILRAVLRTPVRAALSTLGIALAVAVLVLAMQWRTSIERIAISHFEESQRQDVILGFAELRPSEARFAVGRLPGVMAMEPLRITPADLIGPRATHRGAVTGMPQGAELQVLAGADGRARAIPEGGVVLAEMLAEKLGLAPGDAIRIEVLEGARPVIETEVVGLVDGYIGMTATMDLSALNRALGEGPRFEYASLLVDPAQEAAFLKATTRTPMISMVLVKRAAKEKFDETLAETILIFIGFFVAFAGALAMGVVYNAARIALSERGRELATLRVLGFTRGEIAYILLGETALLTLAAIPLGWGLGWGLVKLMASAFETELYRIPFDVPPEAYGWAAVTTVAAATLSGLLVRRRLDRLDLVAVLKTRE
ncbi:MAG TPA: ABC transporter permease [Paracoccaceae bacterium]|nr:ABC transporter permease [Paracoccaceae bacterium]